MKPFSVTFPVFWFIYIDLLLFFASAWFVPNTSASTLGNETDHLALLKFKESISKDPYGVLNSWNSSNHFCNWDGITCSPMHQRVTKLNLPGYQLHGTITPQVGNFTFLKLLDLHNNSFYGKIPQELGGLLQMKALYLTNNSLDGEFPISLTNCSQLIHLYLYGNNLSGKIPAEIGSLRKLEMLFLGKNNFDGQIPQSIGNLSSLVYFSVGFSNLEGYIPQEIGLLRNLTFISVDANKFYGMLPSTLFNLSYLTVISATSNQFNGSLPPTMFHTLPNLKFFSVYGNQLSGPIPISITNASVLQLLDLGENSFVGQVPSLGKMQDVWLINLEGNNLGDNSTEDLDFLKPLTNCSKLSTFGIDNNNFGGRLPNFLVNFSSQLTELYLGNNQILGKLPTDLGNLTGLIVLSMESNHLDGVIPPAFGNFQKIQLLDLNGNKLSGDIPASLGNLSQLFSLDLSQNMFQGNIPPTIGNCQKLQFLDLSQNNLVGSIPSEIFSISSLTNLLNLSQNLFSGNLSDEVGRLKNIEQLDISGNHLSGDIPGAIGECLSLDHLYLQGNSFSGIIPSSLDSLKGLQRLDLSRNNLSGSIPEGLQNITVLEYLNVSFNMLDGEVPTEGVFQNSSRFSITGNSKLCGGITKLKLPPCPAKGTKHEKHYNFKKLIAVLVCVVAFLLILSLSLTLCWMRKRNKKPFSDLPTIDQLVKVSYQNLHNGTDGFSAKNLIGSGNFGFVFKGTLESENKVVAIKVLNLQKKGAHKSFIAECNALRNIRHRNLVKILTCCSSTDYKGQTFKALVFEYMANGSLEQWLHPAAETAQQSRTLNLAQRFNIITDVASAIHYLHYECEQAIIHCDLKPSNILIDDCLVAHVSDFGIARLLSSIGVSSEQTSTTGIKGTIGYAPPEYGMSSEVSIEGDMYSFGILVLEILSGKRPTDEMFKDGQNLHNYVKNSIPDHLLQIVDPTILPEEFELDGDNEIMILTDPNVKESLLSLFSIALACSVESPNQRMSMVDVIKELNEIKSSFFVV
ncbi:hypothetical protein TanjilG_20582 [Lupinus angustifolius]|uniref:non-specific serine/threonine protein kinase n=1 Tax=Lupinus angustifolius TaxID=3871 RepID=A0A4P1QRR7_LUPAN|nr:PREDICTED: probable LRR receptor-like serine/threonine-protein kinase At3g47570 [Lupinus angustifolius]XP_019423926.1 PREDICTED: probable LRR receptor-like serine/threonine-protein kinase At3g47570 [Lupinus angustifolius]OIV92920.1 hypothetical protein TanjilG_20582 [Lupinus angustifolius]